jgi:hypothetical protein
MPWRRYWVTVLSGVMPTQRPLAITASQSSMSVVCSTAGSVPGGHRSVVVVPVRRSMATVRSRTSSRVTERRRAQGSSAARAQ